MTRKIIMNKTNRRQENSVGINYYDSCSPVELVQTKWSKESYIFVACVGIVQSV